MSVVHVLLVDDLRARVLISQQAFDSADEAAVAYGDAEREHIGASSIEIVLVGADSLDTIRKTHGHYPASSSGRPTLPELASV